MSTVKAKKRGTGNRRSSSKKKAALGEDIPLTIHPQDVHSFPILLEALVSQVDDPKGWEKRTGMVPSAMPRYARLAALLSNFGRCVFCGKELQAQPWKTLFHFHPGYHLCPCMNTHRRIAMDHIPWSTPEQKLEIQLGVEKGTLNAETPIYQFMCGCGEGPVVVYARMVASTMRRKKTHQRLRKCHKCFSAYMTQQRTSKPITASVAEIVAIPKDGPGGKFNRHRKKAKPRGKTPEIPEARLPPLSALDNAPETPAT